MAPEDLSRSEALSLVISELDRVYPKGRYDSDALIGEAGMPDFVEARNGHQRYFTSKARAALHALTHAWEIEEPSRSLKVDRPTLLNMLRQHIADIHADGKFSNDAKCCVRLVSTALKDNLDKVDANFTHSIPVSTLGYEFDEPFVLGPVTIMTRDQWIDAVDFSEWVKNDFMNSPEANANWKPILRDALSRPRHVQAEELPLLGLAWVLYSPLRSCRSLVRVSLSGYEHGLSAKAARQVSKTALDGISLIFGGKEIFHQQTLVEERMPPLDHHTLIESKGNLWMPGMGLNKQLPMLNGDKAKELLTSKKMTPIIAALANILEGLVTPASHPHPNLAMRWAMALDWLAESEREMSEAIALTKIGTALDVLTEGGKFGGILNMLTHVTGWSETKLFQVGGRKRDLRWVVKEIYDNGRSKILHGNVFDRLQSFADIRVVGAELARVALIMTAIRLRGFSGADTPKVFRDIPPLEDKNEGKDSEAD